MELRSDSAKKANTLPVRTLPCKQDNSDADSSPRPSTPVSTNPKTKETSNGKPSNAVGESEGPSPHVTQPSPQAVELSDSWTNDEPRSILRLQEAQHGQSIMKAETLKKVLEITYDLVEGEIPASLELAPTYVLA